MGVGGHINVASGYGPWPEGRALRDLLWPMTGGKAVQPNESQFVTELQESLIP